MQPIALLPFRPTNKQTKVKKVNAFKKESSRMIFKLHKLKVGCTSWAY